MILVLILCARGPHCPRKVWLGWKNGGELRKSVAERKERERWGIEREAKELKEVASEV